MYRSRETEPKTYIQQIEMVRKPKSAFSQENKNAISEFKPLLEIVKNKNNIVNYWIINFHDILEIFSQNAEEIKMKMMRW